MSSSLENVRQPRRLLRWILGIGLALIALLIVVIGAFFAFGDRYELAPLAAGRLTAAFERKVTIGSLHVTPGRWLHVELRDFRLANLPTGTQPLMATIASVSADIEAISLLRGPLVVRGLTVNGLKLLLEKKNWMFGTAARTTPPKPARRRRFPTLLNAVIVDGDVLYRTVGGHSFDTHLDQAQLDTERADTPVRLAARGAYNGTPLTLQADLGSFDAFRDAAKPYPTDIRLTSRDTTLRFQGTMTDPLDVDGAKGRLELVAPTTAALMRIAGASVDFEASLWLAGPFEHNGPLWYLSQASGALNKDPITAADVKFVEGQHAEPDNLTVNIAFDQLNANALFAARKSGPIGDADVPLAVDRAPDPLIAIKVSTHELAYAGVHASDVTLSGSLTPGRITVDALSLGYLGAEFRTSGQIESLSGPGATAGGRVTASVDMNGIDVQTLRNLLGASKLPLWGRANGRALVEATGATLNQAAREARLSAVVAMQRGSISRQIIELASTDVRTIFRKASGMTPISCLVGVLDIRGGVGTVSPLRIRSADGTIIGRGTFDIYRHWIDITVASEARTTSLFALDVPIRISGSFASPTFRPAVLSAVGRTELSAGDDVSRLPPGLQTFARRLPCLSARAR